MTLDNEYQRLLEALHRRGVEPRLRSGKYTCGCPVHHGEGENFRLFTGRDGVVRARCFSQCGTTWSAPALLCVIDGTEPRGSAYRAALAELGLADPNGGTANPAPRPTHWPDGLPMPTKAALVQSIGTWRGYSAGDFSAASPADPAEAALPPDGSFLLVAPSWDERLRPLSVPAKFAVAKYLATMASAPPLLLVTGTNEGDLHALFRRSGNGSDRAFFAEACRHGADPRLWDMPGLALDPQAEIPHTFAFYYNPEVPA